MRSAVAPGFEHAVQLFDDVASVAEAVSTFLVEGVRSGAVLLVVAKANHWRAIAERPETRDELSNARSNGRLTVLDASTTLEPIMRRGSPDGELFDSVIGTVVRRLSEDGSTRLHVYGDMVDVLADMGDFRAAEDLEQLWTELGRQVPFTLLCGYSSANFGAPKASGVLPRICGAHTHVRTQPRDVLGTFFVGENRV